MSVRIPTFDDVLAAEPMIHEYVAPAPLIRSYKLEKELGLPASRRVWIKDYGWTPSGSFKLLGALNWMWRHLPELENRPVAAHSSGNFASGIAFAGHTFGKRVFVVMPDTATRVKFELTKSFGADVRTYEIATDYLTGQRDKLTKELAETENALQASPYDDPHVIAGNGVGGWEIVQALRESGRQISHFFCQVSGGGLLAGHALSIAEGFPDATIVAVEPEGAADFRASVEAGSRVRWERPASICDGLLSYDVGVHNWPILQRLVGQAIAVSDAATMRAMRWLYEQHGSRTEPSGAIATAAVLERLVPLDGDGDIVIVLSGRNVDEEAFRKYIALPSNN